MKAVNGYQDDWITKTIRLGQVKKKNSKKPRPLMVCLQDPGKRESILKKSTEIKEKSDNKFLRVNRDQNENSKRRHSLVKACYNLLLKNKYPASMRGSVITFNKKQYDYDMLNMLPDSCTPFMVKTRETEDKQGLCFYSEHTFCSNFYPAKIKYKNNVFTSVEHGFQYLKVKDAGYLELANEMLGMTDPYKLKGIGDSTKAHKDWAGQEEEVMETLIREKFIQNKKIREKLLYDHHLYYYEMTRDKHWATGRRIAHDDQLIDSGELTGQNVVGEVITRLKEEFTGKKNPPRKPKKKELEEEDLKDSESSVTSECDSEESQETDQVTSDQTAASSQSKSGGTQTQHQAVATA